ncbi:MAG: hypothetical protein JXR05_10105 [Flavobacteriaceae bacterium]
MALSSGFYDIIFLEKDLSKGVLYFSLNCSYGNYKITYFYDNTYDVYPLPHKPELIDYVGLRLADFVSGSLSENDLGFWIRSNDSDLF